MSYGDLRGLLVTRSTNVASELFITTCRSRLLQNEITIVGRWDCTIMMQIFHIMQVKVTRLLFNHTDTDQTCVRCQTYKRVFYGASSQKTFHMRTWCCGNLLIRLIDHAWHITRSISVSVTSCWCGTCCFTHTLGGYQTATVIITSVQHTRPEWYE